MYMHNFEDKVDEVFAKGTMPKLERVSHTYDNPSWYYALHLHPEHVELMYVADGKATIIMDRQTVSLKKGDILLINKGITHSIESDKEEPSDIWCCLIGDIQWVEQQADTTFFSVANCGEFQSFIDETLQQIYDFSYKKNNSANLICNYLASCLLVLFRELIEKSELTYQLKNATFALDILKYINENYQKKIDLEHLSQAFFTSASHISREFKKEYGISPINYLIDKRLSEAKWQLINTNETVGAISERVGYPNYYYFAKLFSERIGCIPTEYREKYGSNTKTSLKYK